MAQADGLGRVRWWGRRFLIAGVLYTGVYTALNLGLTRACDRETAWFRERGIPVTRAEIESRYTAHVPTGQDARPFLEAAASLRKAYDLYEVASGAPGTEGGVFWHEGRLCRYEREGNAVRWRWLAKPLTEEERQAASERIQRRMAIREMLQRASEKTGWWRSSSPEDFRLTDDPFPQDLDQPMLVAAAEGDAETAAGLWHCAVRLACASWTWPRVDGSQPEMFLEASIGILPPLLEMLDLKEPGLGAFAAALARYREASPIAGSDVGHRLKMVFGEFASLCRGCLEGEEVPSRRLLNDEPMNRGGWIKARGFLRIFFLAETIAHLRLMRTCEEMLSGEAPPALNRPALYEAQRASLERAASRWSVMIQAFVLPHVLQHHHHARLFCRAPVGLKPRLAMWGIQLCRHKLRTGSYPASLADLLPVLRAEAPDPRDPRSGIPFVYRREGEGFILYSVGLDGEDDQGAGPDWCARGLDSPPGADDIAFRLTR